MKELIRSRLDDLAAGEFQMGSGVMVRDDEGDEGSGESEGEDGEGDGASLEESIPPEGYTGRMLFTDATGQAHAPAALEDLQDSIDALRSTLDMLPLPAAFVGLPYGELVDSLLHCGVVAVGLYRPRGHLGASMPFSLVNPPATVALVRGDLVYALRPGPLFDDGSTHEHQHQHEHGQEQDGIPPGSLRRESSAHAAPASAGGGAGPTSSFQSPPPPPPSRFRPGPPP